MEKAKLALEAAKAKVERAKTPEEKIAATSALEAARELQREGRAQVAGNSHLFSKVKLCRGKEEGRPSRRRERDTLASVGGAVRGAQRAATWGRRAGQSPPVDIMARKTPRGHRSASR